MAESYDLLAMDSYRETLGLNGVRKRLIDVNPRKLKTGVSYMQFPLLKAPLSWQGPMHFHYRDSNFPIAIIAILILSLRTKQHNILYHMQCHNHT